MRPVRAKALQIAPGVLKLLPLQGDKFANMITPGRCPGLRASALSGRAAYMSFCPLPLLYSSASDFQFRYAPVTVGSGRVGKNLRNFNYEPTLKSCFWFFSLQNAI